MQSASDSTEEICNADSSTSGWCQKRTVVENMSTDSDEEKSFSISTSPLFKTPACNWRMKKKRRSLNTLFEEPAGTVACYLKYESPSRNVLDCIEINSLGPSKPSCEVPESLASLLDENNVSWTSSMASPLTADVTWSNLNTEEKKVLLPSHHDSKPRALFSPDGNENSCCKLLELTPVKEQSEQAGSTTPSNSQFLSSPISSYNSKQKRRRRKSKLTLFVKQESSACEKNYSSFSKCVLEEQAGLENDLQCENNSESGMTQHFLNDVSFTTLDEICQASEIMVTTTNSPMEISINVEDCNKAVQCDDQLISSDIQNITLGEKEKYRVLINRTSTPIVDRLNSVPQRKRIKFMSALAEDSVSDYQCWSNSNLLPDVKQKHLAEEWLQVDKSLMDMVTVNLMPTCSDTDHTAVIRSRVQSIRTSNENSFPYFPARNQPTVQSFSKQREIQITDVMKFALTLGAVEMRMDNSSIKPSITSQELVQFSKLETNSNVCNLSTRNNAKSCVEAKVNTKFHIKSSDNSLLGVGSDESTNNSKCSYKLQCNEKVGKSSECQSVTVYEVEPKCEDQFTYIAAGVIDECITFLQSDEKCKTSISQYSIPNTSLNKEEGNRVSLDSSSSKQDGVVDSSTFLKTDSCATAVVPLFEQNRCNEKQDDVQNGRTILKTRKQCCNSEKEVRRELVNCCNRSCDDITHPDLMTKTRVSEDKATYLHGVQAFQSTLSIAPNTKEKSKNDASIPLDIGNTNASVKENVAHPAANQETQKTLSVEPEYKDCADTGSCCNYQSLSDTQMVRAVDDIELMLEYTGEDGLAPASSISTSTVSMQCNSNRNFDRNDVSVKMVSEMSCKKNFTLSNKYSDNRSTECDLQENTSKTVPEKHAASMQSHLTQKSSIATIPQNTSVLQLKPNKIKQVNAPQSTGEECGTEENLHTAREMRQVYDKYMERLLVVSGNDVCVVKGNIETTKYETTPYKLSDTKGFPTAGDKALEDTTNKTQDIFEDDMLSINCLETEGFHTASDKIIHTLENVINETQGNFADATLPVNYLETRGFHVASDKTIHKTEDATLNTEEIFEDVTTLFKLPQVKGFATSSGKALHISEDVLKKTQGVFADDTTSTKSPQVKGFATASGKAIHISEDALKKAKGVFEDDPTPANFLHPKATTSGKMLHISEEVQEVFSDDLTPAKFPHTKGFSAGYRKAIDVSEHSLKKVRGIFEGDTTPAKLPQAKGFATASGKALHISKDALKKAQGVFADDPTPTKCLHPKATDCGKTLHISEDAVEKVQGVFVDDSTRAKFPQVKDFSAGCGKTIHISEDFLNETQGVLDDTLPVNYLETKDFPVASCKIINKTEDAIHNIQEIIEDVTTLAIFPQTKGFATASGKAVHISEDSLKKVRGIFEGDTPAKFHQAKSFSTGIEKTLNISEDALKESQEVLADDTTSIKFPQDKGFVTASGKAVHISEDSLKKVQRIFEGDTMPAKLPQANGFATASGKTIHISEDALKKAQEVFADNPTPVLHTKAPVSVEALHISEDAVEKPQGVFVDDTIQVKFPPVKGFTAGWGKTIHTSEDISNETQWVFADDTLPVNYLETKDFSVASDKIINKAEDAIHNIQEIFEDVTTLVKFPQTKGFATASGKAINISEDSLRKVRGILEGDIPAKFPQAKRFSEGIEKALNISEDALKEAQEVLADDNTSIKFPQAKGFVTASGKAVHISEDSLKKAQRIFEGDTMPAKLPQANGFATASGKTIHISEDALKKAQEVFADNPTPVLHTKAAVSGEALHISEAALKKTQGDFVDDTIPVKFPQVKGFSAECGKTMHISEDSLKEMQGIFADDTLPVNYLETKDFPVASDKTINKTEDVIHNIQEIFEDVTTLAKFPQTKGFATASGKAVHVSEDSLKKVRGIFEGDTPAKFPQAKRFSEGIEKALNISEDALKEAQEVLADDTTSIKFPQAKGFVTASGKAVHISEDSLKRVRGIFEGDTTPAKLPQANGFAIASGSALHISEYALKKAQVVFADDTASTKFPQVNGFATAGGKAIHISEDALKKAQVVFADAPVKFLHPKAAASGETVLISEDALHKIQEVFVDDITSVKFPKVKGFATGSGEAIHVSEDDLKKAERIFADNPLSTNFPQVKGFVTASGELVHISKDSLKKVRGIFDGDKLSQVRSISSASSRTKQISEDKIQIGFAGDTVPLNHSETKYFASSLTNAVHISENAVKKEQETMETKSSDLRPALVDVYTECEKTGIVSNRKLMTDQGYDLSYGKTTSPVKLKYFSTASSKADHLTEVSPKKFQDKEPCGKMKHIYPKPMGFSTGTGKVVSVSEDCLKKARELFSDDNDTTLNRTVTSAKSDVSSKESLSNFVSGRYQAKKKRKTADVQKECEIISKQEVQGDQTVLSVSSNTCHSKVKPQFGNLNISSRDCFTNDNSSKDAVEDSVRSRSVSGYSEKLHSDRLRSLKEVQGESDDCVSHAIGAGSCSQSLLLQEVLECTSALFADEDQLDLPSWATSYVTCPDMVHDRIDAPVPMLSSNSTEPYPRPGSPVLGRPVCFRKVRKKRKSNSSSVSTTPSPAVTTSTFKVPYKKSDTTTPTTVPTHKRVAECIPAGAPFAKKPRTGVSCKLRPEIASRKIHNDGASSVGPRAVSDAVASARRLAAVQQQESIKQGPIQRPCIGSLLMMKQLRRDEQRTWVQVAVHRVPGQYTQTQILKYGVKENITNITAENATEFKFSAWNFYSPVLCAENIDGLPVGDGARLIMDSNGCAGLEQVTRAFLACSGVEPTLVPVDWVRNHYRWLVWKLAATERSFPDLFAGRCLTPNTVLLQLKYRYDREIDCNQRPAVRRIMEKDDASGKRLVLCVAKVFKRTPNDNNATKKGSNKLSSTAGYELELTDGWYSVLTTVDREMFSLIDRGMVAVGTKLVTHGAELLNCDQGCSPLEAPADVRLKLHTNSTRRARWDTKLGYHSNPGPLQVSMSSILPYGGLISCVTVVVARVYPVLFVQKVEGGRSVIRTERTEAREAALFERRHQERAECMYSQERAEFQEGNRKCNRDMRGLSTADLTGVTSGQELCEMLNSAPDPTSLQAQFSEQQHAAVTEYRQGYQDKLLRELETRVRQRLGEENMDSRTVTTLLKVHCLDANNAASRPALLSVWRASEEVLGLFREGVVLRLYSVTANGMRYGDLQLSAGRQTRYKSISPTSHCFPRREVTCLSRLTTGNFYPAFGELDVVGVVIYIGGGLQQSTTQQTLYLANADMSLFGITFWGGIKKFGWEEVLKPTAVIAASNLQWHHTPSNHNIPYAYASEVTTFSQNPRQPHLQEAMILLKQDINTDINKFVSLCKEIVLSLLTKCNYNSPQSLQDTEFDGNHRSFATGAAAVQGIHPMKCNADERTCTTESGSDQKTHLIELSDPEQENTPSKYVKVHGDSTVTESPAVQRRLSKLQLFGDPPPLSPLFFSYPPSALKKSFQVPVKNPPDPVVPDFTESPPLNLD